MQPRSPSHRSEDIRAVRLGLAAGALTFGIAACSGAPDSVEPLARPESNGASITAQPREPSPAGPGPMGVVLDGHNRARKAHCAEPLQWSSELATAAQRWADRLAKRGCALEHSASQYGENLAAGTDMGPEGAVEIWYEEAKSYPYRGGGFSMSSGHFTQMVWKGSKRIGCGVASCDGMEIWVCNYDPPGNMKGGFASNVSPPTCK